MGQRLMQLLGVTLAGIAIGVCGDLFLSPPDIHVSDIVWGVVLSPLTVTVGGRMVSIEGWDEAFLLGGILFWPVYASLSALWLRYGKWPFLIAILPWAAQGFFQIGLRMAAVSSV